MKRLSACLLAGSLILSGCVTTQDGDQGPNKQTIGAIVGGLAGALLGSKFGSGTGKLAAVALGGLAGLWLGSEVGASLDKADRQAIERETARALATRNDGQTVNWSNPENGVSANITPVNSRVETRSVLIVRDHQVSSPPPLNSIGRTYEATKTANLRAGPSTDSKVVGQLRAGQSFHAVGQVQSSDWILVAQDNRSTGYVYAPLVQVATAARPPEMRPAVNLDDIKLEQNVVAEKATMQTECRTIKYDLTVKSGQKGQEQFDACKGADGAWEIL